MADDDVQGWSKWWVMDVLRRVPPLFVLDAVCGGVFTVPWPSDWSIDRLGVVPYWVIYILLMTISRWQFFNLSNYPQALAW